MSRKYITCIVCGTGVSKNCKKGHCSKCRPRSGKDNPFYGKTHTKDTIEKIKIKTRIKTKELWKCASYRTKVKDGTTGKKRTKEFSLLQSLNAKKQFSSVYQRNIRSDIMKASWEKGLIVKNNNVSYNKSKGEIELYNMLLTLGIDVDNKTTIRSGTKYYFPDIVASGVLVIEYYGDYWHGNPLFYTKDCTVFGRTVGEIWDYDSIRINNIKNLGYDVIIIWESNFKEDKENTVQQIVDVLYYIKPIVNIKG